MSAKLYKQVSMQSLFAGEAQARNSVSQGTKSLATNSQLTRPSTGTSNQQLHSIQTVVENSTPRRNLMTQQQQLRNSHYSSSRLLRSEQKLRTITHGSELLSPAHSSSDIQMFSANILQDKSMAKRNYNSTMHTQASEQSIQRLSTEHTPMQQQQQALVPNNSSSSFRKQHFKNKANRDIAARPLTAVHIKNESPSSQHSFQQKFFVSNNRYANKQKEQVQDSVEYGGIEEYTLKIDTAEDSMLEQKRQKSPQQQMSIINSLRQQTYNNDSESVKQIVPSAPESVLSRKEGLRDKRRKSINLNLQNFVAVKKNVSSEDRRGMYYGRHFMVYYSRERARMLAMKYQNEHISIEMHQQLDLQTNVVTQMLAIVDRLKDQHQNINLLDQEIGALVQLGEQQKNNVLHNFVLLQVAKILQEVRFLRKSLRYFRILKRSAVTHDDYTMKMKAYYGISKSLLMLKKYDASRLQTAKLLQISWFINYPKHELKAYNLLGLYFFYTGDIYKASYYEDRYTLNHSEVKTSSVRRLCVNFLRHKIRRLQELREKHEPVVARIRHNTAAGTFGQPDDSLIANSSDDEEQDKNLLMIIPEPPPLSTSTAQQHPYLQKNQYQHNFLGLDEKELFKECQKTSVLQIPLREQLPFNPHTDIRFYSQIKSKANHNIRQPKHPDALTWVLNRPRIVVNPNRPKQDFAPVRNKMFLNHMSNLRHADLRVLRRENSENLMQKQLHKGQRNEYWERANHTKVSKILSKMSQAFRHYLATNEQLFSDIFQGNQEVITRLSQQQIAAPSRKSSSFLRTQKSRAQSQKEISSRQSQHFQEV